MMFTTQLRSRYNAPGAMEFMRSSLCFETSRSCEFFVQSGYVGGTPKSSERVKV